MSIFINKELRDLIPPLSDEEYQQLEENIVAEGIRDPLVVWRQPDGNDMLIDGHNRWSISLHHAGILFETVNKDFADMDEAKLWIIDNQLGKRNLIPYDKVLLQDRKKDILAAQAEKRKIEGNAKGGKSDKKSCPTSQSREEKRQNSTDYKIAKAAGTSEDTVRKVRAIDHSGDKELIRQVRDGETTINKAYQVVKKIEPQNKSMRQMKQEQLEQVKQEHADFQSQKVVDFSDIAKDKKNRRTLAKEAYARLLSIGSKIEAVSMESESGDLDLKAVGKELTHEEKKMLLDMVGIWRQQLTKICQEVTGN